MTAGPLRALQIQRLDITYPVTFYGSDKVMAVAYDVPVPGYDTLNTNSLRLWSAMPTNELDLAKFNDGDYNNALKARQSALEITQVFSPSNLSEMVCSTEHRLTVRMVTLYRSSTPTTTTRPARSSASSSSTSSYLPRCRT